MKYIQTYEANRRIKLPIEIKPKRDLKESYLDLSDYLQEIFDKYGIVEAGECNNTFRLRDLDYYEKLPRNRWYISDYDYRSKRLIIYLDDREVYHSVLNDIESARSTLNSRLGDGLRIRIHNYVMARSISIMITQHKIK